MNHDFQLGRIFDDHLIYNINNVIFEISIAENKMRIYKI